MVRTARSLSIPSGVAAGVAAIGIGAMAVMAATPGSPYHPVLTPDGEPTGPLRSVAGFVGLDTLRGTGLVLTSTLIAAAATLGFLVLLREAFRGHARTAHVVAVVILGHVLVLLVPLLFSRDVYSYAYYGRIARGRRQPVRGDAARSLRGPAVGLRRAEVGRHALGLRAGVDEPVLGRRPRPGRPPGLRWTPTA